VLAGKCFENWCLTAAQLVAYHATNTGGRCSHGLARGEYGLIHFGPFEPDSTAQQLRKRGVVLRLQPKQFLVLLMLAERAGEIVSRQEIQQRVWGDGTFVDFDRGINFCINQIRAALGDDADRPRYIETIPRRGYRFIAKIDANGKVEPDVSASLAPVTPPPSRDNEEGKKQALPPESFPSFGLL
jgi:DNA-binding winged helix-turn-helix (wHTH) protein